MSKPVIAITALFRHTSEDEEEGIYWTIEHDLGDAEGFIPHYDREGKLGDQIADLYRDEVDLDDDVVLKVKVEADPEYVDEGEGDGYMDGDHDSAMASAGWGTDEDYGFYGDDGPEEF